MKKIDTIVFDLDGTLLDTLVDLRNSVAYAQEKYGYPVHDLMTVRSHVGSGIRNLISRSIPDGENNPEYENVFNAFKGHYGEHCNDETRPYDGIMEILKIFKEKGYKMAIVSNKADFAVKNLNQIYFKEVISVAIGENEAGGIKKKPAPDTVFAALKQLGSSPEKAVYIGDSEVDILTAQNSGMPCVLCEWGFREKEDLIAKGGKIFAAKAMDILTEIEKM